MARSVTVRVPATSANLGPGFDALGVALDWAGEITLSEVATATVPKLTVIVGGSFGAGNYAMCGRAYGPRFLWCWPNAKIGA